MTQAINRTTGQWTAQPEQSQPTDLATIIFRPTCPRCGALSGQWRGYRETRKAAIHRRWCSSCNKWFGINLCQEPVSDEQAKDGEDVKEDQLWFDAFMEAYEDALSRGDAT